LDLLNYINNCVLILKQIMKIELPYTELSEYVQTHFNQEISVAYIDSKTVM